MADVVVVPPGGGVPFGNVEFLGLSEHSPRLNVLIITMRPGAPGPDPHVTRARPDHSGARPDDTDADALEHAVAGVAAAVAASGLGL